MVARRRAREGAGFRPGAAVPAAGQQPDRPRGLDDSRAGRWARPTTWRRNGSSNCRWIRRSDLFSLGVIVYEMATGRLPFAGASPSDTVTNVLDREPEPLTTLAPDRPLALEHVVVRLLAKRAADRYQSAEHLAEALARIEVPPSTLATRLLRRLRPGALVAPPPPKRRSTGVPGRSTSRCGLRPAAAAGRPSRSSGSRRAPTRPGRQTPSRSTISADSLARWA